MTTRTARSHQANSMASTSSPNSSHRGPTATRSVADTMRAFGLTSKGRGAAAEGGSSQAVLPEERLTGRRTLRCAGRGGIRSHRRAGVLDSCDAGGLRTAGRQTTVSRERCGGRAAAIGWCESLASASASADPAGGDKAASPARGDACCTSGPQVTLVASQQIEHHEAGRPGDGSRRARATPGCSRCWSAAKSRCPSFHTTSSPAPRRGRLKGPVTGPVQADQP